MILWTKKFSRKTGLPEFLIRWSYFKVSRTDSHSSSNAMLRLTACETDSTTDQHIERFLRF